MTARERYLAAMLFGSPDRIPFEPGAPRESTLRRWRCEGLDPARDWFDALCSEIGLRRRQGQEPVPLDVNVRMIPAFEEKVLEHRDGHYIVRDWMGNITEISDEYDYTYIRSAKVVTRKWHSFPVKTRADFAGMKERYDSAEPSRYPSDFEERAKRMMRRDYPVTLTFPGPFWQAREWCGFEPLCMLFIEDPDFVREMVAFWEDFVSRTMERALAAGVVDRILISEDMAYKQKSMISPAMAREFLQPAWSRWAKEAREAGVEVIDLDSDGCVDELIPIWIESGINACNPMEVAAGNDIVACRRSFGRALAYSGGVDKRAIAKGGAQIENELRRIEGVVTDGGYIPGCDHGVPPDVSWPDFLRYGRLLAELTGWL
jgi:uroporphyrinogen decarboxylase